MDQGTPPHEADTRTSDGRGTRSDDCRRRLAAEYLSERDSPVVLDELAAVVAARESGRPGGDEAPSTDEVALSLHHVHLPRLVADGVAEYDAERNVAAPVRTGVAGLPSDSRDDGG